MDAGDIASRIFHNLPGMPKGNGTALVEIGGLWIESGENLPIHITNLMYAVGLQMDGWQGAAADGFGMEVDQLGNAARDAGAEMVELGRQLRELGNQILDAQAQYVAAVNEISEAIGTGLLLTFATMGVSDLMAAAPIANAVRNVGLAVDAVNAASRLAATRFGPIIGVTQQLAGRFVINLGKNVLDDMAQNQLMHPGTNPLKSLDWKGDVIGAGLDTVLFPGGSRTPGLRNNIAGSAENGVLRPKNADRWVGDMNGSTDKTKDFYRSMRNGGRELSATVSRNTGISEDVIERARRNMFVDENTVPVNDGRELMHGRFEPNDDLAEQWKGALNKELTGPEREAFRKLMAHEYVESRLMADGIPYQSQDAWTFRDDVGMMSNEARPDAFGAHDLAPSVGYKPLGHWPARIGPDAPDVVLGDDLSNIDDLVDAIQKSLKK